MKIFSLATAFIIICGTVGCSSDPAEALSASGGETMVPDKAHNSRNSVDWFGTYRGTLPCADCEGVKTKLTLNSDDTFRRTIEYLGRDERVHTDEGIFHWSEEGDKIAIDNLDGSRQNYLVGENMLIHLDRQGEQIKGSRSDLYKLYKNHADPRIENIRWELAESSLGSSQKAQREKQAFVFFNSVNSLMSGHDGCNAIRGEFELMPGGGLALQFTASTKMACPDMVPPNKFRSALDRAETYSIGDTLVFFARGSEEPLLKFTKSDGQ